MLIPAATDGLALEDLGRWTGAGTSMDDVVVLLESDIDSVRDYA